MESKWDIDKYVKAYKFAANAHIGQLVPDTNISYLMHLSFVTAEVINSYQYDGQLTNEEMDLGIQCALLHDVIEDTNKSYEEVEKLFGKNIADGVLALTKNKNYEKTEQMKDCLFRIKECNKIIWRVKLSDRITNLQPPPSSWKRDKIALYANEAIMIMTELGEASNYLKERIEKKINEYESYYK